VPDTLPRQLHDYDRHHLLEASRWQRFVHRPGDIVVSTSYKAGTTWAQTIIANLLFQDGQFPAPIGIMSPWLEMRLRPAEVDFANLEAQTFRRSIKTHLPLSGMPYHPEVKYVVVARDGRDVFMSMLNHHSNYTPQMLEMLAQFDTVAGGPFPFDVGAPLEWFRQWTTRAVFDWEHDGYPYWSHLHHFRSWWDYRHLPNILLVHFADLLADPLAQVRRLATYLDIPIDEQRLAGIMERISFRFMRDNFAEQIEPMANMIWKEGGNTFMNKGTNGRWRDLLGPEELALYDAAVARVLPADAAQWLEHGGPVPPAST
jgi:aryl sulfotransferase